MLKRYASWFGIVFIIVGILGFIPGLTSNGMLLGIFAVDGLHNIVHLLTGVIALWVGIRSERASRLFFQIFGVVYGLVTILGFIYGNAPLLGVMAHNWADVWLHLAITAVSLYLGFFYGARRVEHGHPVGGPR